jgi:sulfate adenylyltransferase
MMPMGTSFYGPYAAQELVRRYADQLEIEILPFEEMVYVPERGNSRRTTSFARRRHP